MSKEKLEPKKDNKTDKAGTKPAKDTFKAPKKEEYKKIIRLAEADLDGSKKLIHVLTSIKGISWSYANAIVKALNLQNKQLAELSTEEMDKLKKAIENPQTAGIPSWLCNRQKDLKTGKDQHLLSSDLDLSGRMDVRRLKTIKCYRGVRHYFNYKVRGQRTRSRGANVRGRVGSSVGVIRKKTAPAKGGDKK